MIRLLRRPAAALATLAVLALPALGGCGDDDPGTSAEPDGTTSAPTSGPSPEPTSAPTPGEPTPTPATPEEFCAVFRAFASVSNVYVSASTEENGAALVAVATKLASLDPAGLSPGGQIALDQLVNGSLDPLGVTVEPFSDALPDQAAFDAYLEDSCPA